MDVMIYIWVPVFAKQKLCLTIVILFLKIFLKLNKKGATEDGMDE